MKLILHFVPLVALHLLHKVLALLHSLNKLQSYAKHINCNNFCNLGQKLIAVNFQEQQFYSFTITAMTFDTAERGTNKCDIIPCIISVGGVLISLP